MIIAAANAVALAAPVAAVAIGARTLAGVGLGLVFLAGSAYVREQGASHLRRRCGRSRFWRYQVSKGLEAERRDRSR